MQIPRYLLLAFLALAAVAAAAFPQAEAGSADSVTAISAGGRHTCAITSAGGVQCWGQNDSGQLGDGTTADSSVPIDVAGLATGIVAISSGSLHTCALTTGGEALCWGQANGQLGTGAATNTPSATPAPVCADAACATPLAGIVAIAASSSHTCAVTSDATVKCWGDNEDGQLGDGTQTASDTPVDVVGITTATAITTGESHSCALTSAGAAVCWGSNGEGQIGDDRACGRRCSAPSPVAGLDSGVASISAGGLHTCALLDDGTVRCWGFNFGGQSGDGTSANIRVTPVPVSGLSDILAISANGSFRGHTCAITAAGGVACWGDNANGQLGDGTTVDRAVPVAVAGLSGPVVALSSGDAHACAIVQDGRVLCWGHNGAGQLGDGTQTERHLPVAVGDPGGLAGDANCDAEVNSIDAALALQRNAGLIVSLPCEANADVNVDGEVNSIDAALILQFVAGLLASLPP